MSTIRELVTEWGFDVDAKALFELEDQLEKIQNTVKVVGAAAIGAGAALFGMAKLTSAAGKDIEITAGKVGLSTDALQEYRFAAEQAGVETSQMDSLFFDLNKTLGEARLGFGAGREGIELLARETGILIDLNGNVDQQFQQISNALANVSDEAKRAAIAEKFFGSQGREMIDIIGKGTGAINKYRKEFRELGGVMGGDTIKSAMEFEKMLSQVKTIFVGVRNELAGELLPTMNELVFEFKEWFKANREIVKQNIRTTISLLVTIFKDFTSVLKTSFNFIRRITNAFGGLNVVAKTFATIMAVIMGLKLAHAFGTIAMVVGKILVGAFTQVGRAAILAQLKMLAIPIAVTAAISAIALVIEDVVGFINGKDSVTERVLNWIDTTVSGLKEKFGILGDIVQAGLALVLTPVRAIVNAIQSIGTVIDVIMGKVSVLNGLKNIAGNIANTFGLGVGNAKSMIGLDDVNIKPSASSKGSNTNVNANLTINTTGMSSEQAERAVSKGVEDFFGKSMRKASRDTEPSVLR